MPIDDENKRRSIAGIPPIPDGTIDDNDRRHIAGLYRGFETPAAEEAGGQGDLLLGVLN